MYVVRVGEGAAVRKRIQRKSMMGRRIMSEKTSDRKR